MPLNPVKMKPPELKNYIEKSQFEFTETYNAGNVIIRIQPSNNLFAVIMDSGTVMIADEFLIDLRSFLGEI